MTTHLVLLLLHEFMTMRTVPLPAVQAVIYCAIVKKTPSTVRDIVTVVIYRASAPSASLGTTD